MPETADNFRDKQAEFVAYIRDPEHHSVPEGIQAQRMAMYRELMFNNVQGFLANNFPVLRKLLDDSAWLQLAQDFFLNHRCSSPYFAEIPEEFLNFLETGRVSSTDDPGFLLELAHYEWVEMALSIATDTQPQNSEAFITNPENYKFSLSALAWPLAYRYPVHKISPDFQPKAIAETPTYLIVYRNADLAVKFIEINAMTYRMLELVEADVRIDAEACFQQISKESGLELSTIRAGGLSILRNLAKLAILEQAA